MYRESVVAMRKIGHDCIEKRIKVVNNGEEAPNDILTQIIQSCGRCDHICQHALCTWLYLYSATDKSVDMETLVDNFVTFYIAGGGVVMVTHKSYALTIRSGDNSKYTVICNSPNSSTSWSAW